MWGLVSFLPFAFTDLRHSFATIAQKANTCQDENFLQFYVKEWDRYTASAKTLNRLFSYLHRYWVRQERDEGKKSIHEVYTVCVIPAYF